MPTIKLSDPTIRALRTPDTGQITYWDEALSGFGVRLASGGSKSFIVMQGEQRRRVTIGRYPVLSLADARAKAKRIMAEITLGTYEKPMRANTFEYYLEQFLESQRKKNRARTAAEYTRLLKTHFSKPFGKIAIDKVEKRDISKIIEALIPRAGECQHALTALKVFYNWCIGQGFLVLSPCAGMKSPTRAIARERVLSIDELKKVLEGCGSIGYPYGMIVQLLALTGQRRNEIASLRWEWIDSENKTITLPSSLTKNKKPHTLPYGDRVAEILATIPNTGSLLFPARGRKDVPFSGWSKAKNELDTLCAFDDWVLHDLRRSLATGLAALGTPIHVTEKLLNHVSGTMAGIVSVYQRHAYMDEMREAIGKWEFSLNN